MSGPGTNHPARYTVACPKCKAKKQAPCLSRTGKPVAVHMARIAVHSLEDIRQQMK